MMMMKCNKEIWHLNFRLLTSFAFSHLWRVLVGFFSASLMLQSTMVLNRYACLLQDRRSTVEWSHHEQNFPAIRGAYTLSLAG